MNCIKPISTLLLVATFACVSAPHMHAQTPSNSDAQQLMYMYAQDPEAAIKHVKQMWSSQKQIVRDTLIDQYATEVDRLGLHSVHPKDLMMLLSEISPSILKTERWRFLGVTSVSALMAILCDNYFLPKIHAARTQNPNNYDYSFASKALWGCFGLSGGLAIVSITALLTNEVGSHIYELPKADVSSLGFLQLRDLRRRIAKELVGQNNNWFVNNRLFVQRATLGLAIEKAYSKKQLQAAAIGGAVLLGAALLYMAVSSVRRNTKAAAVTIGAGALGGLAALLSLSPLATPVINERLKRLENDYQAYRREVRAS